MLTFKVHREYEMTRGAFFPEPEQHSQRVFNITRAKTMGYWRNHRLIVGDLRGARALINRAVSEYDFTRMKHPEITNIRIYDEMPQLLDTAMELWRYSGSLQSISRESVLCLYNNGQIRALDRNASVGFSGIVRQARTPWSQAGWVQEEFRRAIVRSIATRGQTTRVSLAQAMAVLEAERQQLLTEHTLALAQLQTTFTDARFAEAIAAWDALVENEERRATFVHMANVNHDTLVPLPLPTLAKVKELWKQGFINDFTYEEYAPFLEVAITPPGRRVTMNRGAVLTDNRMFMLIHTNPQIQTVQLNNPPINLHTTLQFMTYGSPPEAPVTLTLQRQARPGGGGQRFHATQPVLGGWMGDAPIRHGWTILTAKDMPEPQLTVFTTPITIDRERAALLQTALPNQKPVLVAGQTGVGVAAFPAPVVVLPEMMVSMAIRPAVANYYTLQPLDPNFKVSGSIVQHDGYTDQISRNVVGFLARPLEGRPSRIGILPDLFGS